MPEHPIQRRQLERQQAGHHRQWLKGLVGPEGKHHGTQPRSSHKTNRGETPARPQNHSLTPST